MLPCTSDVISPRAELQMMQVQAVAASRRRSDTCRLCRHTAAAAAISPVHGCLVGVYVCLRSISAFHFLRRKRARDSGAKAHKFLGVTWRRLPDAYKMNLTFLLEKKAYMSARMLSLISDLNCHYRSRSGGVVKLHDKPILWELIT